MAADARLLTVALAAVTTHDARGPVAVDPTHHATAGELVLGNGPYGELLHRAEAARSDL